MIILILTYKIMWTLFSQEPRKHYNYDLYEEIEELKHIAKQNNISYLEVLKTFEVLELRRKNDLFIANWDILDEQLAWFGQLIESYIWKD